MRRRQKFEPFVAYDVYAFVRTFGIAAQKIEDGFRIVKRHASGYLHTLDIAEVQVPARWGRGEADPRTKALEFKSVALRDGATPEAIRLIGTLIPLNDKECREMAEKLKAKGSKAADTKGLKSAASKTPVAKKTSKSDASKRRGNPEALAKARAARAANKGPDNRKITVVKKDHGARAGTKRADMLNIVLKAKTVQTALDNGATMVDIRFAQTQGLIKLSDK